MLAERWETLDFVQMRLEKSGKKAGHAGREPGKRATAGGKKSRACWRSPQVWGPNSARRYGSCVISMSLLDPHLSWKVDVMYPFSR